MLGIVGSFKPQFYKKVVSQRLARSFGFLILFVIVIAAVIALQLSVFVKTYLPQATGWVQDNFEVIASEIPDIAIEDGELVTPQVPYVREWDTGDEGVFAVVIDPTTSEYYRALEHYENVMVLTRTKLVFKATKSDFEEEINTYDLENIASFRMTHVENGLELAMGERTVNLTAAKIKQFLERLSGYTYPTALIFLSFAYFFSKAMQLFIFSIFSSMFNSRLKAELSYGQLLTIGIYALVPGTVLAIVQELTGVHVPLYGLLYCAIYVLYLYLGIKASKQEAVTVTGL
ncbi:DUF1189 family protein [Candidatus Omnitrophota bacterium]